jgi:hypothetical protein
VEVLPAAVLLVLPGKHRAEEVLHPVDVLPEEDHLQEGARRDNPEFFPVTCRTSGFAGFLF